MKYNIVFTIFFILNTFITGCFNQLRSDDICVNDSHCFAKQNIPIRIKSKNSILFKPTECKCPNNFKYKCGINFCVKSKNGCDEANWKALKREEANLLGIKKCSF